MIIYKLTFRNGKGYIGQTVRSMNTRLAQHKTQSAAGSLLAVHCAWRKHGAPQCEIIGSASNMQALHAAEIAAIREHGTLSPGGYNLSYGGETAPSRNPEVSAKIAARAIGRVSTQETKAKLSAETTSRWRDPDYRAKVNDGVRASWTPERRAAAAERARNQQSRPCSDATKQKIREKALNMSADTRAKMSTAAKARVRGVRTKETCTRLSSATTQSWKDPDIRARRAAAIREGHRRRKEGMQQ